MANVFNIAKNHIANQTKDIGSTDVIDCALIETVDAGWPILDTSAMDAATVSAFFGDPGFAEANDASYTNTTAGRRAVTIAAFSQNDTNDTMEIKFTQDGQGGVATWESIDNDRIRGILFYWRATALGSTNDATAVPFCVCDLDSDVTCNGGDLTITFPSNIFMLMDNSE
jgi:hypothetical protein